MKVIYCILLVAAIAGCSKREKPLNPIKDSVICINSGIEVLVTREVVVDVSTLDNVQFLRRDVAADAPIPSSYAGITAIGATRATNGNIIFDMPLPLYATNNDNAFFVAYWPKGTTANDIVTWAIDAKTDILVTQPYNAGKYSAPINGTTMIFKHQLAQLEVICVADNTAGLPESSVQSAWGKITKIEIQETRSEMKFNYAKPSEVVYETPTAMAMLKSDYTSEFELVTLTHTPVPAITAAGMFAPADAATTTPIKLKIYTEKVPLGGLVEVQLTKDGVAQGFEKGLRHTVTLRFKSNTSVIEVLSATIDDWQTVFTSTEVPFPANAQVGDYYYADGTISAYLKADKLPIGLVFWVDATNSHNYKIVSLDEPRDGNNDPTKYMWSTTTDQSSPLLQDEDDGSNNNNSMRNIGIKKFLAAMWCNDYHGEGETHIEGMWYLPAKKELAEVYKVWSNADGRFKKLITDNNRTDFSSSLYWSSTQNSDDITTAHALNFGDGQYPPSPKNTLNNIRCIRK